MASTEKRKILGPVGCSAEVLLSIDQIFDILYSENTSNSPKTTSSVENIDRIERRLKNSCQFIDIEDEVADSMSLDSRNLKSTAELYRLAALVYLHRAVKRASPYLPPITTLMDAAFVELSRIETCDRMFPLFIVSCEARSEQQRLDVLRIFRTTEERSRVGNVARIRGFVKHVWALDDLDTEAKVTYADKITAALSTSNALPTFT